MAQKMNQTDALELILNRGRKLTFRPTHRVGQQEDWPHR